MFSKLRVKLTLAVLAPTAGSCGVSCGTSRFCWTILNYPRFRVLSDVWGYFHGRGHASCCPRGLHWRAADTELNLNALAQCRKRVLACNLDCKLARWVRLGGAHRAGGLSYVRLNTGGKRHSSCCIRIAELQPPRSRRKWRQSLFLFL